MFMTTTRPRRRGDVYTVLVTDEDGEVLLRQYPTSKRQALALVRQYADWLFGGVDNDAHAAAAFDADDKVVTVRRGPRPTDPPIAGDAFVYFLQSHGATGR
jgi:hypothetical protein